MQLFPTNFRNHRWHKHCNITKDQIINNVHKKAGIWQTSQSLIEVSSDDGASKGRKSLMNFKISCKEMTQTFFRLYIC